MVPVDQPKQEQVRIPLGLTDLPSHSLFLRPPPPELYHYTTLDGACGIVESKSLHLTKFTYLNDRSELTYAIQQFQAAANRLAPKIRSDDRRVLLTDVAHQLGSFERTNICVASFCEDPDLLSQWRAYGHVGKGIALGFSGQILGKTNNSGWAHLVRCIYDSPQQQLIVNELMEMLLTCYDTAIAYYSPDAHEKIRKQIIGYFNTTFLRIAPVLKDHHFSEEKEWRIVTAPRKTTDPKFRARVSNTRISQYYVYDFEQNRNGEYEFLPSVVVGPTEDADHISDAVNILCMRNSVLLRTRRYSQIPYRG